MDDSLSELFLALQRHGAPDFQARRDALLELVSTLTSDEITSLQDHLRELGHSPASPAGVQMEAHKRDIIVRLPEQLTLMLTRYLTPADFLICLIVSDSWRDRFSRYSIALEMAQRFELSSIIHGGMPEKTSLSSLVLEAAQKRQNRYHGLYHSFLGKIFLGSQESLFQLDDGWDYKSKGRDEGFRELGGRNALYSHGKLAWTLNKKSVVVDDLSSKKRRIYRARYDIQLKALDDKRVLVAGGNELFAWQLNDVAGWYNKKPIAQENAVVVDHCSMAGDFVSWITNKKEVYLWQVGCPAIQFKYRYLIEDFNQVTLNHWLHNLRPILDTRKPGRMILVTAYPVTRNNHRVVRFAVHVAGKYRWEDGQSAYDDYKFDLQIQRDDASLANSGAMVSVRPEKCNDDGLLLLGFVLGSLEPGSHSDSRSVGAVQFDIITMTYALDMFLVPGLGDVKSVQAIHFLNTCQVWNHQLVYQGPRGRLRAPSNDVWNSCLLVLMPTHEPLRCSEEAPLFGPSCFSRAEFNSSEDGYDQIQGNHSQDKDGVLCSKDIRTRHTLGDMSKKYHDQGYSLLIPQAGVAHGYKFSGVGPCMKITGDDDFLVMIAEDGFMCWRFHSDETENERTGEWDRWQLGVHTRYEDAARVLRWNDWIPAGNKKSRKSGLEGSQ